jgi:hypothetical protein
LILQSRAQRVSSRRRAGQALLALRRGGPRGPQAVRASLERGLRALGLEHRVDPSGYGDETVVGVLSDLDALAEAIAWRRGGDGRRLVAGPNMAVLPSDAPELMTAPEIDVCVVPSAWVQRLYEEDAPALRGRVAVWPAGVDAEHWRPGDRAATEPRRALVYRKDIPGQANATDTDVASAVAALEAAGFTVETARYGDLAPGAYLPALQRSDVLVFFTPTESQCIAQVEAWSCDVPTLVWAQGRLRHGGREYESSSAPYLTRATGRLFSDAADLRALLARWDELRASLAPRAWVLEHMTDAVCAQAYWDLAHG